jgi:hypothetical protein
MLKISDGVDIILKDWATPRQVEYIDYINEHRNVSKASIHFNVSRATIFNSILALKKKAASKGYAPESDLVHPVADPYIVKGVSTYYNKDGERAGQWVKTSLDQEKHQQMMLEAIEALKDDIPRISMTSPPPMGLSHLLNCYVITDYHMGMLAWHEEAGDDWDLKIAEDMIIKWFSQAIHQSPHADNAVFAQLGDFLHFDGMDAVTPASKHLLDVDTRFAKLVRVAIRVLRQIIDMLLQKHQHVHVIMADANHDPVSQIWLREWFAVFYENEPRITVERSPNPYNAYEFGNTALFFHHGHKKKIENLSEVFVAMFRDIFGRTKYAYAHTGHLHHTHIKETPLMILEQHETLAANDAYAARGGYISGRSARVITYSKHFGEVSRLTINSDMLKGRYETSTCIIINDNTSARRS